MQSLHSVGTAKFSLGAQSDGYNHSHASQMGHAAALRLKAAKALSGASPANFKAALAGHAATKGHTIGDDHIHAALDSMAAKGKITAFQAHALKSHNGHLTGPQGHATQTAIMDEMLSGRH